MVNEHGSSDTSTLGVLFCFILLWATLITDGPQARLRSSFSLVLLSCLVQVRAVQLSPPTSLVHSTRLVTSCRAMTCTSKTPHPTTALPRLSLWSSTVTSRAAVHSYLMQYFFETCVLQCSWFIVVFVEFKNRINDGFVCVNPLNMCNELQCVKFLWSFFIFNFALI